MFKLFADLIGFHLDVQERLRVSETALLDERKTSELREQFIAVLGHDLRNPLASIDAGVRILRRMPLSEKATQIVSLMGNSASRMAGLIDNVLDFARGRLGGGFSVTKAVDPGLKAMLEQTVAEMRTVWPDRVVQSHFALDHPVACDSARIAQLLSNLLANAFIHGDPGGPVRVEVRAMTTVSKSPSRTTGSRYRRRSWVTCSSRFRELPPAKGSRGWDWGCISRPRSHAPMMVR